jgi:predicted TIM-barrel fold metal-dependent hydrolase
MKLFDSHVHVGQGTVSPDDLLKKMDKAGIDKTILFSEEPDTGQLPESERAAWNGGRLKRILSLTAGSDRLYPVYYVNVIEKDAPGQVDSALDAGVTGFKVICGTHYPDDERAMPVYAQIAGAGKPILFHSGILWDFGANARYNRPGNFEILLLVPKLKFALAHIGWPWCDEMMAVYGKFLAMQADKRYSGQEMYIDLTPGTPPIYRREALTKLLTVGYDNIGERLLFGSDNFTDDYSPEYAREWAERDLAIFDQLHLDKAIQDDIFYNNAMRFWNLA